MPKLKPDIDKETKTLIANIAYYQKIYGDKKTEVFMRKSRTTYYTRMKKPTTFTVGELMGLAQKYHTSIIDLFIPKENKA